MMTMFHLIYKALSFSNGFFMSKYKCYIPMSDIDGHLRCVYSGSNHIGYNKHAQAQERLLLDGIVI